MKVVADSAIFDAPMWLAALFFAEEGTCQRWREVDGALMEERSWKARSKSALTFVLWKSRSRPSVAMRITIITRSRLDGSTAAR